MPLYNCLCMWIFNGLKRCKLYNKHLVLYWHVYSVYSRCIPSLKNLKYQITICFNQLSAGSISAYINCRLAVFLLTSIVDWVFLLTSIVDWQYFCLHQLSTGSISAYALMCVKTQSWCVMISIISVQINVLLTIDLDNLYSYTIICTRNIEYRNCPYCEGCIENQILSTITLVRLIMIFVLLIRRMSGLLIKPGYSLTIMIFIFTVFISVNIVWANWRKMFGSPKVPRQQTFNLNMKINATLFWARHIYLLPSGILFKRRDFTLRRCEFDRHLCSHLGETIFNNIATEKS